MSLTLPESEIIQKVTAIISEALRVKPEKILPQSKLFSDLGSESLDILDIRFRLEKAFNIKIEDGEIISSLGQNLTNQQIDELFTVENTVRFVQYKLMQI